MRLSIGVVSNWERRHPACTPSLINSNYLLYPCLCLTAYILFPTAYRILP